MVVLEEDVINLGSLPRYRFNRDDYYQIAATGLLNDDIVELIEGDIVQLPPPAPIHSTCSLRLYNLLYAAYGKDHCVMMERPVVLSDITELLPDLDVARGSLDDYEDKHPDAADICLVVEISNNTLRKDRTIKARLYASKGIPEYWIVNVAARQIEVYRTPSDSGYGEPAIYRSGQSIEPVFAPGTLVPVSKVFGPA